MVPATTASALIALKASVVAMLHRHRPARNAKVAMSARLRLPLAQARLLMPDTLLKMAIRRRESASGEHTRMLLARPLARPARKALTATRLQSPLLLPMLARKVMTAVALAQ